MPILLNLAPEVELLAKAKADAKGIALEDYLPQIVAEALQQQDWEDESASTVTLLGSDATMQRLWNSPEEDEAWKDL